RHRWQDRRTAPRRCRMRTRRISGPFPRTAAGRCQPPRRSARAGGQRGRPSRAGRRPGLPLRSGSCSRSHALNRVGVRAGWGTCRTWSGQIGRDLLERFDLNPRERRENVVAVPVGLLAQVPHQGRVFRRTGTRANSLPAVLADADVSNTAVVHALSRQGDDLVLGWISEHVHRLLAALHTFDLLLEELAEEDDAHVGGAQLLEVAIGDLALRGPAHDVLAVNEVGDELAVLGLPRHLHVGDVLLWRRGHIQLRGGVPDVQRMGIVHRDPDLSGGVGQHAWEHHCMLDAAFQDAMLEQVEADASVVTYRLGVVNLAALLSLLAQDVVAVVAVEPLNVRAVERVLHDLDPVAGNHGKANLPYGVVPDEGVVARQQRSRLGAEVGEDESTQLLHRIAGHFDPVLEGAFRWLGGLLQTGALAVEQPAVVGAAQPFGLGNAVDHRYPAVRTALLDEAQLAGAVAIEHEILAEQPDLLGRLAAGELCHSRDRLPVTPQQLAAGSSGTYPGQLLVELCR